MNKIVRIFILFLFFSCGIQTFEYISGATVISSSLSNIEFRIDLKESPNITNFILYSRYYIESNKSTEFKDITLTDTPNGSDKYLIGLGYNLVGYLDDSDVNVTSFKIENSSNVTIKYTSTTNDTSLVLGDIKYKIRSMYKNSSNKELFHFIGDYSDDDGEEFKKEFLKNKNNDNVKSLFIEFAIINKGLSSSIEYLESLPIYLGTLQIQI